MSFLDVLLLGLVQGITEFLPISSTAHLRVVPALLGQPDPGAALTAVLQLGSLVAVIGFFLRDLVDMVRALLDPARRRSPQARMLLYMVVGTIPIGILGLAFKHHIEGPLQSLRVIAVALIVVAVLMAVADRLTSGKRELGEVRLRDAVLIGAAQALALVPGVSRWGSRWWRAWRWGCGVTRLRASRSCCPSRPSARRACSNCPPSSGPRG